MSGRRASVVQQQQQQHADRRAALDKREDFRLAKKSLKVIRAVCKEYGLAFKLPQDSSFKQPRVRPRGERTSLPRQSSPGRDDLDSPRSDFSSSSESHASSYEFSSAEEDPDTSLAFRPEYAEVKGYVEGIQADERIRELHAINESLQQSCISAQDTLTELDAMDASNEARSRLAATPPPRVAEGTPPAEARGQEGDAAGARPVVDHALRRFAIQEHSVTHAVRRCIDTVPRLQGLAREKAEKRLEAQREEAKLLQEQGEETEAESVDAEQALVTEVEDRLKELGDLDEDAHPELLRLSRAQKAEAKMLAAQIQDMERDVQVKTAALAVVEGRVDEEASLEIMGLAIKMANATRAAMFEQRKEEVERLARQEGTGLPTEAEVQAVVAESQRLHLETGRVEEQIRKMRQHMERMQAAAKAAEDQFLEGFRPSSVLSTYSQRGMTPTWSVRSGTRGGLTPASQRTLRHRDTVAEINARLQLPLDRAGAILQEALVEKAEVEARIAEQEARIIAAEDRLRSAGTTLLTLEEAKVVYLEQVGHDYPKVLQDFMAQEAHDASDSEGLCSDSDSDFGKDSRNGASSDTTDLHLDPVKALAAEETALRASVEKVAADSSDGEEDEEDKEHKERKVGEGRKEGEEGKEGEEREQGKEGEDGKKGKEGGEDMELTEGESGRARQGQLRRARTVDSLAGVGGANDVIVQALHKLTGKLKTASALSRGDDPPAVAAHDDGAVKDAAWEAIREMSREEAGERLRQLPAQDIRALLALERNNTELMMQIGERQHEIDFLRSKCGASQDLLGPTGVLSAHGAPSPEEAPSETLVSAVKRKARDLQALRKKWWEERQKQHSTVRRTMVLANLPEGDGLVDDPPPPIQTTVAERVWDSVTMP